MNFHQSGQEENKAWRNRVREGKKSRGASWGGGLSQKSLKGAVRGIKSWVTHAWSFKKGNFTPVSFQGTRAVHSA